MPHTDPCLNALIQLKATHHTLKIFQELPSSSSDSGSGYPPRQGTQNALDTSSEVATSSFCFSIMDWLNSSDHLFHLLPVCPPFSQLFWLQVFGGLLLTSCLHLQIAWQCKALALSFPPLLLTADPPFFPSSKQLLKALLTLFFKVHLPHIKQYGEDIKKPVQFAPASISTKKSLCEDPQCCGRL